MTFDFNPLPLSLGNRERLEVSAEGLGCYTIDISLPEGLSPKDRLPVILVLDADILFDVTWAIVHNGIASMGSRLPPSIIVGVGYPADEGFASFYGRRNFDFHEQWDMTDPMGQRLHEIFDALKASEGKPELELRAGGYHRFLRFLGDELLPGLARRYPLDLNAAHTLIGDSSGGHFALRALFDPRSPFSRYVAISPSLGAAQGAIQRAEADYAATHADLAVDVFVCAGGVEVDESQQNALARFGSGVIWTAEQFALRQWPSARLHWEIMNLEDHASIAPRAIAAGLRSVHQRRPGVHAAEIAAASSGWNEKIGEGSIRKT